MRAMTRPAILAAATLALLLAAGAAATARAQGLVILARGGVAGAHPVGSTLAPGTMLAAGERIDVLERGGTRRLDGPAIYAPVLRSSTADNARLIVAQLLDRRRNTPAPIAADFRRRSATVRGLTDAAPGAGEPSTAALRARFAGGLWTIAADRADATCVTADVTPRLWHEAIADAAGAALVPADGGVAVPVRWAADAPAAAWPLAPPAVTTDYVITRADGVAARVRIVPLARPATLDTLVVALDAAGCRAQLGYLLDQYPATAPASAPRP